jgi:Domain of Unknown Function (DUF928)
MLKNTHWFLRQITSISAIAFAIMSFAQLPARSQQFYTAQVRYIQPALEKEPENRGAPDNRKGAGTRGNCPAVNKPELTALVPLVQKAATQKQQGTLASANSNFVLGLTTVEYPTFWFYVPYSAKDINSVKFVLLDEQNNPVTQEPIPINLSGTPGVISVRVPTTSKPLEIGKYYHWYFLMDCNPQSRSEDIAVEGLVKRIQPNSDLQRRLQAATPQQRIAVYAQAGIWQDALTLLGELRRNKPQDTTLVSNWKELLGSVQLQNIATEAIAPCCTSK